MKEESKLTKGIGFVLAFIVKLNFYFPQWLSYGLSLIASKLSFIINSKSSQIIKENINLCFPNLNSIQQDRLLKAHLKQNANMSKETAIAWLGTEKQITDKIANVAGEHLLINKRESQRPIIIAVPHIGNWEFFWHWLQLNYSAISMYSTAKFQAIDKMMYRARIRFGGQPFSTNSSGMLNILKGLKQGKIMMILPDQAPNLGAGIYSPFFGHSAYTMTLLHRLIEKTNAQVLFGACLRNSDNCFNIKLYEPNFNVRNPDIESFNQSLNEQIQSVIMETPEQYLWNYKRFKRQPFGKEIYTAERKRREQQQIISNNN
ncbi:MAG: lysophospholipid acyltransferase family protein [Kangiellaceae bacterium]